MSSTVQALLAFAPILLGGVLLVGFRMPAKLAMPLVYLVTAIIALTAWDVSGSVVAAATVQGLVTTFELLLIIFGAILLLNVLEQSGGMASIRHSFRQISPDRRVQVVLMAWLFGSFVEGASGFGTPAAIASPLLVALGFPAACAVMLGMMIQSTAVTFGAVGTPILIGVQEGIKSEAFLAQLQSAGLSMEQYLQLVTVRAASLHALTGVLIPTLMVMMMTRFFGARKSWTEGLAILPFTLLGGLAFTIPYLLTAIFLGPEFPSLAGGLIGLGVMMLVARTGFLVPADPWEFPDRKAWPEEWVSRLETAARPVVPAETQTRFMPTWLAWTPYVLLTLLLLVTRLSRFSFQGTGYRMLPRTWLTDPLVTLQWEKIFGTDISAKTTPLYLPAFVFFVTVLLTMLLHRMRWSGVQAALGKSSRVLLGAGFVLIFTVPMVRIYINSDRNSGDLSSMPIAMASWVADNVGQVWPAFAGVIGALGAFIAGSNTVSNLMFSTFQHGVATRLDMSSAMIVALQAVGAAAGNMIAVHNVVAASATVGLLGCEGSTLRKTILPTIYYLMVIGTLGLLAVFVLDVPRGL